MDTEEMAAMQALEISDEVFELLCKHEPCPIVMGMVLARLIAYIAENVTHQPEGADVWLQYLNETVSEVRASHRKGKLQ